jgi:hypothetical protein
VLDEGPDRHLVGEPHGRRGQPAVGDLAAQDLEVLGDPRRQPVAVFLVGLEPLQFVIGAGHLQGGPGDLRRPRQRRGGARVEQPRPAPHERDQEQLGHRIQVQRQQRALAVTGQRDRADGNLRLRRNEHRQRLPVVQHRPRADQGGAAPDEPTAGRLAVVLQPRQPDPVPVTLDVEGVRVADVGDPGAG